MRKRIVAILAVLLIGLSSSAVAQVAVTNLVVDAITNRQDYFEGDTITVTGRIRDNTGSNRVDVTVVTELRRPTGITVGTYLTRSGSDGSFRQEMVIPFVGDAKANYTIFLAASKDGFTGNSLLSVVVTPRFGGGGCIIATATFGSELSPEVQLLRNFRDGIILKTVVGTQFMIAFNNFYYSFSPYVAPLISSNDQARAALRPFLYPLIGSLRLAELTPASLSENREIATVSSGIVASLLIGSIYISPFTTLALRSARLDRLKKRLAAMPLLVALGAGAVLALGFGLYSSELILLGTAGLILALTIFSGVLTTILVREMRSRLRRKP